jgi:hypothetical protein
VKSLVDTTRRIITIQLDAEDFCPGNALYERVTWCFGNTCTESYSFLVGYWDISTAQPKILSSSNVSLRQRDGIVSSKRLKDCLVPDFPYNIPLAVKDSHVAGDMLEWLGLVQIHSPRYKELIRLKKGHQVDPFICMYSPLEPFTFQTLYVKNVRGFLIPEYIKKCRDLNHHAVGLSVLGYPHSSLSWSNSEHGYSNQGENDYALVCATTGQCLLSKTLCSKDRHPS